MKSRIVMVLAVFGLLCSGIAFAQDGGLGKKGGGKSGGSGGGSGSGKSGGDKGAPPPQRGGGGGGGGSQGAPPPQRGGGGGGGGSQGAPPPQRGGGGGGGGQVGGGKSGGGSQGAPPPQRGGGDGLGKKGGGSGGSSGGSSGGGQVGRSGGGEVPLGRPERGSSGGGTNNGGDTTLGRPQRQGESDSTFGKRGGLGRNGGGLYEGDHNLASSGRVSPLVINNVPVVTSNSRIVREANRENRVQVIDTRYRSGYCHYDRGWHDNDFCYPYYGFAFYSGCNYVPSPFYYYYHLPGYIDCVRVSIGPITWTRCETRYDWAPPRYDRYGYGYEYDRYGDFDYCVGDISRSFESRNLRYIAHLIPTRGRVEIDMGYGDQYTLSSDDFYDMMRDLVEGTRTTSYRIRDVYRDGDRATVIAIHEYTDPWGRDECVKHTYGLRSTGRGYEICYFRSDRA